MIYNRSAIMRDAHKRYRDGKRLGLGWSWGQCLSTAWAAAKMSSKSGPSPVPKRDGPPGTVLPAGSEHGSKAMVACLG